MLPLFSLHTEDEGRMVLRNFGVLTHHCTVSKPETPRPLIFVAVKTLSFDLYSIYYI
jgi:hypothetical protein